MANLIIQVEPEKLSLLCICYMNLDVVEEVYVEKNHQHFLYFEQVETDAENEDCWYNNNNYECIEQIRLSDGHFMSNSVAFRSHSSVWTKTTTFE